MPIYRLLQQTAFTPEDIALLVKAYEDCLRALNLATSLTPKLKLSPAR